MILSKWALAWLAVVGFACASQASAAILVQDNFDGYADQAAFQTAWPLVGALPSGTLTTTQSVSAPNSINYGTVAQRNERSFTESGIPSASNVVRFSLDFYDSDGAVSPYRQHSNLQDGTAPSGGGQLVALGLNNNRLATDDGGNYYMGRVLGFTPSFTGATSGAFFKLNDPGAPLRSTGWHNLAVEISDTNFRFFVDGILSETVPQTGLTLRSYDVVRLGSGLTSTREAFFDNVSVQTIPEPSTLALIAMAGIGLLFLRRRRKLRPTS